MLLQKTVPYKVAGQALEIFAIPRQIGENWLGDYRSGALHVYGN